MSQPGPPSDQMRVAANHDLFVSVAAHDHGAVTDRVRAVLSDLGFAAGGWWASRNTSFRQGVPTLREIAMHPAQDGWVAVVPAWNDEEFLGLLARHLSFGGEAVAVTWHLATGYHSVARFTDGALDRHIALYSGDLVRSLGTRFPTESYDEDDLRARLLDAPEALEQWLASRGIDPRADRLNATDGGEDLYVLEVTDHATREHVCLQYLAEVDGAHPDLLGEVGR